MISSCNACSKPSRGIFLEYCILLFLSVATLFFSLFLCASPAYAFQAVFSWDPPTTNTDGTPLTDLAGYKVYYGTASRNYTQSVDVGNVTTYTASNLTSGTTYYFAATAHDTAGNQSDYSTEVATAQYSLTVSETGSGSGTVTASGINCGSTCSAAYSPGTVITLSAAPSANSTFTGWSGGGCSGTGQCSVTVNGNLSITATFNTLQTVTYNINATAGAGGSISPSGSVQVNSGAAQSFTITPNTGYTIAVVQVDGQSKGPLASYAFTNVNSNHTIAATFREVSQTSLSVPNGQRIFMIDPPVAASVYNIDPSQARPIGVGTIANGGSALDIQVGTIQFAGPADIYFGIFAPSIDPVNIYVLTPRGLYPVAEGLVPWKANTLEINEHVFGTIPVSALPQGTYYLYLVVTPSGSIGNYYLWQTSFTVQ